MDTTLSQIFRHLTHELKRPLASLQQSVYLLLDEVSGPLTAEQRRILEIQLRNAKRVSSCLANLGDLSQLEAGVDTRQLASHDLAVVIEEVINGVEYELKERGITIKVDLPAATPVVQCDRSLIRRAIGHVENARNFRHLEERFD
jgi:two-component system sensor histidine kinase GlrK